MGKARILGNNAEIFVSVNGADTSIGEVDRFSAKNLDELKKSQPLGQKDVTGNVVFKGWELSFEGGKVDWNLATLLFEQDDQIAKGGRAPVFKVRQKITYYNDTIEEFEYPEVSIYGYELDVPAEELSEKFTGFCGKQRTKGGATSTTMPSLKTAVDAILTALGVVRK